jgi:hypothetical protein
MQYLHPDQFGYESLGPHDDYWASPVDHMQVMSDWGHHGDYIDGDHDLDFGYGHDYDYPDFGDFHGYDQFSSHDFGHGGFGDMYGHG